MVEKSTSLIRLDAFVYICKNTNTTFFFLEPDICNLLTDVSNIISKSGDLLLPEIHENYVISHKISQHGYFIYDFALPLIVLYTLYSDKIKRLKDWLIKSPM
ncbi:MAG: hypothetical protein QFY14_02855 [Candidatus Phytoplasma pruni]|nr:hypothetical protein [Candidatus Phytoplasma pruni]MDW3618005.1 hypothetical protein [Candidatus Phytoplasma pruni]